MSIKFPSFALVGLASGLLVTAGCQDSTTYDTRKPVIENEQDSSAEEAGEAIDEAMDDAADAVTPDRSVVDVDSPLGDVDVTEDPATGRKRVDVDAGADNVDDSQE